MARKAHVKPRLKRMKMEQPEAASLPTSILALCPSGHLAGANWRVQVMASYRLGSGLEAVLGSQVPLSLRLGSKVLRGSIKP